MLSRAGSFLRQKCAEALHQPSGDEESTSSADERDDCAFDQLLAEESTARGADGAANGEFAAASPAAREKEIADVRACDEKDEPDSAEEHE